MTRLVTLAELLGPTSIDNGAQPLFDADSIEVEPGPTAQQCVIHAAKNTSAIRKLVAALDPRHPEVSIPAPKEKDAPKPATGYPLPSAQVLAATHGSVGDYPKGHLAGHPEGAELVAPDRPTGSGSPSKPVDAAFEAQDPQPDGEVLQPHQAGAAPKSTPKRNRAKRPSRSKVVQDGKTQSTTASTQRSPRPAAGTSDRPAAAAREQEKT